MVQLSTPGVTPNRGMGPPVRRFLSNYFDLLLPKVTLKPPLIVVEHDKIKRRGWCNVIFAKNG